jgi:hypothetical protein
MARWCSTIESRRGRPNNEATPIEASNATATTTSTGHLFSPVDEHGLQKNCQRVPRVVFELSHKPRRSNIPIMAGSVKNMFAVPADLAAHRREPRLRGFPAGPLPDAVLVRGGGRRHRRARRPFSFAD